MLSQPSNNHNLFQLSGKTNSLMFKIKQKTTITKKCIWKCEYSIVFAFIAVEVTFPTKPTWLVNVIVGSQVKIYGANFVHNVFGYVARYQAIISLKNIFHFWVNLFGNSKVGMVDVYRDISGVPRRVLPDSYSKNELSKWINLHLPIQSKAPDRFPSFNSIDYSPFFFTIVRELTKC